MVYKNLAIKCMLCKKVVKKLEKIDNLPVNHTIMIRLTKEQKASECLEFEKKAQEIIGKDEDNKILGQGLSIEQQRKQAQKDINILTKDQIFLNMESIQKFDNFLALREEQNQEEEQLEYCGYHEDKVKHYYCMFHKSLSCRICAEMMHSRGDC